MTHMTILITKFRNRIIYWGRKTIIFRCISYIKFIWLNFNKKKMKNEGKNNLPKSSVKRRKNKSCWTIPNIFYCHAHTSLTQISHFSHRDMFWCDIEPGWWYIFCLFYFFACLLFALLMLFPIHCDYQTKNQKKKIIIWLNRNVLKTIRTVIFPTIRHLSTEISLERCLSLQLKKILNCCCRIRFDLTNLCGFVETFDRDWQHWLSIPDSFACSTWKGQENNF